MLVALVRIAINLIQSPYSASTYVSQAIFGLAQGGIYALIALGYTLVYGILFMINFAHGEIFMGGAYRRPTSSSTPSRSRASSKRSPAGAA